MDERNEWNVARFIKMFNDPKFKYEFKGLDYGADLRFLK